MKKSNLPAPVHFCVEAFDPHAHLWRVTLRIAKPARSQILSLPVWIPGSYMVREFSKHLQHFQATQNGKACAIEQLSKCSWQLTCITGKPLEIGYEIYAFDNSVRASWLDAQRGFFNPSVLCVRVQGQENQAHSLTLQTSRCEALKDVASAAIACKISKTTKPSLSQNSYWFDSYDHLADTPFEIGNFWRGSFKVHGVVHEWVVSGATPSFDGQRLLADTKKIAQAHIKFWHGADGKPPFQKYVFMLHAVDEGYGGLEHGSSTALICSRRDLPRMAVPTQPQGYTTLLGLISHEYFHAWNVKRLKPKEFLSYDYSQENYTQMLWFFEGFTSYYDDLALRRADLIDNAQYLRLLSKAVNQVQQTPGRKIQSVAQSSMDAWVKYYRQDENTPNATVSYYTKGALVALCFDLSLRAGVKSRKTTSLDHVLRWLWVHSQAEKPGHGGITEKDFAIALQALSGRSYAKEIAAWIHGTEDLPLQTLLAAHGCNLTLEPAATRTMAQRMGVRVNESSGHLVIKTVLRGSLAESAGLAANDELLAVNHWRIHQLEDLTLLCGDAPQAVLTVARDKRLLNLSMRLPPQSGDVSASFTLHGVAGECADKRLNAWLLG
jgi:predicted metalloprotease with PDZ domain